jgi:tRNA dimethylallyltransferase
LVITGPTAVGKTAYAIAAAQALNGEIVSADSRQTYRQMDIGTAKPNATQQATVPHHLLDVVEPDENLSLAEYQRMAYAAIDAIHERGHLPLLVGGTGQYITAVIEGWTIPEVPPDEALRAELEAYAATHGYEALQAQLAEIDPEAASRIDGRNIRRVIRAIEIVRTTGQTMDYAQRKNPPPYQLSCHILTMERERLYTRADSRIDAMMRDGFVEEVRSLLKRGYSRQLPAMSGLGYRELAAFVAGETTLDEALEATRRATRDFIRRQYTWFRGHSDRFRWNDVDALSVEAFITTLRTELETA